MSTSKAFVDYNQLHIAPMGVDPVFDAATQPELAHVVADGKGLIIVTGITAGPILVTVTADPAATPSGPWDERTVLEMEVNDQLVISSPTVSDSAMPGTVYAPMRTGPHRVTVLAHGRRAHPDEFLDDDAEPTEEYVVIVQDITA
jgi:hypothetical protein